MGALPPFFQPLRIARLLKCAQTSVGLRSTIEPHHRPSFTTPVRSAASLRKWYQSLWQPRHTLPPYEHVTQVGDPLLRRIADSVPSDAVRSPEVQFLVDRLVHVMRAYKCVGLAAPQIGTALRVIVMEFTPAHMKSFSPDVQIAKRMALMPLTVRNLDRDSRIRIITKTLNCHFVLHSRFSLIQSYTLTITHVPYSQKLAPLCVDTLPMCRATMKSP